MVSPRATKWLYARDMAFWLLILVVSVAWWWFAVTPTPVSGPQMRFVDAHADAPQTLCPGDVLDYDIAVQVARPGVYSVDASVWRLTPPATVVFSDERRVVFSAPANYALERTWQIPPTHADPTSGEAVPWRPGHYERRHAISSVSRPTEPSIVAVPFAIGENCK